MGGMKASHQDRSPPPERAENTKGSVWFAYVATFAIMACFWIVFSTKFDRFHLTLGAVSCALVSAVSSSLLFPSPIQRSFARRAVQFGLYIPWLLYQIFLANVHVVRLAFHPRMLDLIDPQIIEFESRLKSDFSRTTFANSITLTPGTITVNVSALGKFSVHCIDTYSGQALPGDMEARIARVFGE